MYKLGLLVLTDSLGFSDFGNGFFEHLGLGNENSGWVMNFVEGGYGCKCFMRLGHGCWGQMI